MSVFGQSIYLFHFNHPVFQNFKKAKKSEEKKRSSFRQRDNRKQRLSRHKSLRPIKDEKRQKMLQSL